ncbi:hypothetical protein ACHAW6_011270 [Cyclotella cf. meneghiniana]
MLDYLHSNDVYDDDGNYELYSSQIDLDGYQGITSCFLEGVLLYPLKTLAYGVPYSTFVDNSQISIQFGMKFSREFDFAIQALYMKDYFPGFLMRWTCAI